MFDYLFKKFNSTFFKISAIGVITVGTSYWLFSDKIRNAINKESIEITRNIIKSKEIERDINDQLKMVLLHPDTKAVLISLLYNMKNDNDFIDVCSTLITEIFIDTL